MSGGRAVVAGTRVVGPADEALPVLVAGSVLEGKLAASLPSKDCQRKGNRFNY